MLIATTIPKPYGKGLRPLTTWMFVLFLITLRAQASELSLAWDPSPSTNVGGYSISYGTASGAYTTTVDVGNVTNTTVSGLTAGTTYYFAARAYDTAKATFSAYSNQVSGAPGADTTAPGTPANLSVTAVSSSQINLSWGASTDNVGVTGYRIESCQGSSCTNFAQIGTASGTTYSNTGLTASTTYRYRVRATDAAGNLSSYSSIVNATTPAAVDTSAPSIPASLTATAASAAQINLSWSASTDNVGVTGYRVQRCQGTSCTSFAEIATLTGTSYADTGLAGGTTYRYRVQATDAAGNSSGYSSIATAATATTITPTPTACTSNCTVWPSTAVPGTVDSSDTNAVEVGLKFQSDVAGQITGIRFYKAKANSGTHIGNLWSANGQKLASAKFTNESGSGWQQVKFATPVTIAANTVYVASYYAPVGRYSIDQSGLNASVDNAPLHALSAGASSGNGVYAYGRSSRFPSMTYNASNYWVDVVFNANVVPTSCTSNCTIWPSTAVPATIDDGDLNAVELGVKFKSDVAGKITGIRFYKGSANTGTHVGTLWSANGTKLASATFTNETGSGWQQVNFATPVTITANTVYVASYHAPNGRYSADQFGLNANVYKAPLSALGDGVSGANGLYNYSTTPGTFPASTWNSANYWVDVVFSTP